MVFIHLNLKIHVKREGVISKLIRKMRLLRSQYLNQQQCIAKTTTTETTLTALKLQPDVVQTADGLTKSNTIACSEQISRPFAIRRNSYFLCESQSFQFQVQPHVQQTVQPQLVRKRRKTFCSNLSAVTLRTVTERGPMQINLLNVQHRTSLTRLKLVFDFSNPPLSWYTDLYRKSENDMWMRIPRLNSESKKRQWYYKCSFCNKMLCSFDTMRSHLNIHMGWNPHECLDCSKSYPSRKSLVHHHHATLHRLKVPLLKRIKKLKV